MRSAPSVVYPVLRSRRVGLLMAALWCLGALPVSAWLSQVAAPAGVGFAVVAWTLLTGGWCAWRWWHTPSDRLVWDGQSWNTDTVFDARLALTIDLQSLMVLRLSPVTGRTHWLLADRSARPADWHMLRCAVTAAGPGRAA